MIHVRRCNFLKLTYTYHCSTQDKTDIVFLWIRFLNYLSEFIKDNLQWAKALNRNLFSFDVKRKGHSYCSLCQIICQPILQLRNNISTVVSKQQMKNVWKNNKWKFVSYNRKELLSSTGGTCRCRPQPPRFESFDLNLGAYLVPHSFS